MRFIPEIRLIIMNAHITTRPVSRIIAIVSDTARSFFIEPEYSPAPE
jgi:hypothetical protein